jgi:hypothetical protein
LISADRLLKIFDRLLLAAEAVALLVMEPAKLLENLSVVRITIQHFPVCGFGIVVLRPLV